MTDPTRVTVNGLDMSTGMWTRVMAAVRGLYPQQSAGLSDTAAVQAVMLDIVTGWLAVWEGRQAGPDPSTAAQQAAQQAQDTRDAAEAQARTDATDIHPTVTT